MSPTKNLQKRGPVRSLRGAPGLHQLLCAQTSPEFSSPGGRIPLGQEKPSFWRCHLCHPRAVAEMPVLRPLSAAAPGLQGGAMERAWTCRPVPEPPPPPKPDPDPARLGQAERTPRVLGAPKEGPPQAQPCLTGRLSRGVATQGCMWDAWARHPVSMVSASHSTPAGTPSPAPLPSPLQDWVLGCSVCTSGTQAGVSGDSSASVRSLLACPTARPTLV